MIDLSKVRQLTATPKILKFAEFMSSAADGRNFPSYKALDLMRVPDLVGDIWVGDFRKAESEGTKVLFSGSRVDENYGYNVTGRTMEEVYVGTDHGELIEGTYKNVRLQKRPAYTMRCITFMGEGGATNRCIESLLVPCSENDRDVDYAVGLVLFKFGQHCDENIYLLL